MSVVFISNLPNKGYSTEKIHDLAKPFGSLKDVVILSSHKKVRIYDNYLFINFGKNIEI